MRGIPTDQRIVFAAFVTKFPLIRRIQRSPLVSLVARALRCTVCPAIPDASMNSITGCGAVASGVVAGAVTEVLLGGGIGVGVVAGGVTGVVSPVPVTGLTISVGVGVGAGMGAGAGVATAAAHNLVPAATLIKLICAGAAIHDIVASAAEELIVSVAAVERVIL